MKKLKYGMISLFIMFFIFIVLNYLFPLNTDRLNKPKSTLIYDNKNHLIAVKLSSDGFLRIPIKKETLNSNVKKIVLAYEDQYFEEHFGVNPFSIIRALWFNLSNQGKIGASTITMQVARMMHNEPRTLGQKLIEMFQAFQLEWQYSKEEILTFYLNNAPYGGNVEGFASASFKYFQLPPSSLSLSQVAYLTSIPKNPNSNRPKKNNQNINPIKNRLLERIKKLDLLKEEDYQRAKQESITVNIQNLPNKVPHLTAQIKKEGEVHTSIKMSLQERVQNLISSEVKELKNFNIHNGAAMVIENKSMNIIAYVASQDFYDTKYGGQNNGLNSLVSPGSTLKPFVYVRALEEGLITPLKKLFDVPLFIDGYKPMNYSKEYLGEVTATEALQLSLNIPAVELDRLLKKKSLYTLLQEVNITSLNRAKSYYGSSLTLGGLGLPIKNNAELFAMLANGGLYQKASYLNNRTPIKPKKLLSSEATYLVSNILADAPRRSFSSTWGQIKEMNKIAFKTGTSAHAKDMLTIGYTPEYTVAVWYGNFSGAASKKYQGAYATGLKTASPTLFKIFRMLGKQTWFQKPKGIKTKNICQDAIQLGTCKQKIKDQVITTVNPQNECHTMRAEVLSYLQQQGSISSINELSNHACYKEWKSYKPLITSPIHDKTYTYNALLPQELKKTKLECFSFEEKSKIYWLINSEEPIVGESGKPIYKYLSPTVHNISCVDEGAKVRKVRVFTEEL
ncbi:MAG: Penicillin-insensitive transglycosylase (EC & transpeptidase PBP-1C [uncultured Sulfurovum sp.]|uniref:peptidoglycan glycosyltransferase n=1 Tax=uncultured Sulfurovum sp. TaxID=269237 RepID=A0A6S6SHP7_9BACT|nr:MAG: Penicillin-insensitive transglycosylase (EC & transpeptidase PBP-1C [uncultured Sulfurovum sp.]